MNYFYGGVEAGKGKAVHGDAAFLFDFTQAFLFGVKIVPLFYFLALQFIVCLKVGAPIKRFMLPCQAVAAAIEEGVTEI